MKSNIEPPLRFAIGYANNAVNYLDRLESSEHLEKAIKHFRKAIAAIEAYGAEQGVEIRRLMRT